jgi:hypothetical protein
MGWKCLFAPMKSPIATWKSVVFTFLIAVIFYALAYSWMSRQQTGKGPWQVTFMTNASGTPSLIIAQSALGISNITVQFPGEQLAASNSTGGVAFAKPKQKTPFGFVIYDDLMFQPGDVALDCFGHVVEMVPSAFGLNSVRFGWTNNSVYSLSASNKLSAEARKKFKGGYRR